MPRALSQPACPALPSRLRRGLAALQTSAARRCLEPLARRHAPYCLRARIEHSAAPQPPVNFVSLPPSCIAATTTSGPSLYCRSGHRTAIRRPAPWVPGLTGCPLYGPPARTVQCKYRWLARLLGLPSVCATVQSACPDCPVPPPPYFVTLCQVTPPVVPAGSFSPRIRPRPLSSSPRFAPLPASQARPTRPRPPRPLRFAHTVTVQPNSWLARTDRARAHAPHRARARDACGRLSPRLLTPGLQCLG